MLIPKEIHLFFLEGPRAGQKIVFNKETIKLGRDDTNDVVFGGNFNKGVSRNHAQLYWTSDGWEITDGSKNGTKIGNELLHQNSRLLLGVENIQLSQTGETFRIQIPVVHEVKEKKDEDDDMPESPTMTKIIPMSKSGFLQTIIRQPFFLFGLTTVVAGLLMFGLLTAGLETGKNLYVYLYELILGIYFGGMIIIAVRQVANSQGPYWILFSAALLTSVLVFIGIPLFPLSLIFRPPIIQSFMDSTFFPYTFIGHFVGAGLLEELIKAIPLIIAIKMEKRFYRMRLPGFKNGKLQPLMAVVIGSSSGVGFILVETLLQYVPNLQNETSLTAGLMLLIPRFITGISGHVAWSGFFAYFIGLAHVHKKSKVKLILIGWIVASFMHGLWNACGGSLLLGMGVGVLSFIVFIAYLFKARESFPETV
ncbi:MAG: PrsW family intramembrane metalloprotease [Candidatus Marinimicrobia bacterium]|nr:PrsW family intramembrane metalloprotease [Candidatus Neomarinimicrobiota bacterium]MBT6930185.1 PrsW family intramembrane metalloprotease [Candidatus Neomarinimicrobiota bacterium]MBT7114332.1 PrsW family intramembrane metalloprotease [Candidatus Neomarinimicrobiota bacterium]